MAPFVLPAKPLDLREASHYDRPSLVLSNDKIELTVLPMGGSLARIVLKDDLKDDPEKTNPLWDSLREDRDSGLPLRKDGKVGHFVCVDGFGPSSREEQAAGLGGHGEAPSLLWTRQSFRTENGTAILVQTVRLPIVQETFTRTIKLVEGENVILIHGALESLLAFDRPAFWAEHACIGSPFLEPGITVVDLSKNRATTRPWKGRGNQKGLAHRLADNREFTWPMAPTAGGGTVDLRETPAQPKSEDQTGQLMASDRPYAFVTALHPRKRLLLGYVFKPSEFPWLQNWESYGRAGTLARGLEFGSLVFGRPRREAITENRLFGELLYRWLPARAKIEASFLMFWTRVPEGFRGVDDIQIEPGGLRVSDRRSGKRLFLKSSQRL